MPTSRKPQTKTDAVEPKFTTGDLVQLKSGGPEMTVGQTDGATVYCDWSEGGKTRSRSFLAGQLVFSESKQSDLELSRRIAYLLDKGVRESGGEAKNMNLEEQISYLKSVK